MPKGRMRIRDGTDSQWRYTGAHAGEEWVRITLPSGGIAFSSQQLTIASALPLVTAATEDVSRRN